MSFIYEDKAKENKIKVTDSFRSSVYVGNDEVAKVFKDYDSVSDYYHNNLSEQSKRLYHKLDEKCKKDRILKLKDAKYYKNIDGLVIPKKLIIDKNNKIIGYTMNKVNGISLINWDDDNFNLDKYTCLFYNLDELIKKLNDKGIISPDLLTDGNILINDNKPVLLDYDDMQIGKYSTCSISSNIGNDIDIAKPKYIKNNGLFTTNIDKRSLLIAYFIYTFNIDLNKIKNAEYIDDIFRTINLNNDSLEGKVYDLFNDNKDNSYLGDDILKINNNYDLFSLGNYRDIDIKALKRK